MAVLALVAFAVFVAFGARAALYAAGVSDGAAFFVATALSSFATIMLLALIGKAREQ